MEPPRRRPTGPGLRDGSSARPGSSPRVGSRPRPGSGPRCGSGSGSGSATNGQGPANTLVGLVIEGDYVLRRVLARGSESIAFVAEQASLGRREVVVKVLDEVFWRIISREKRAEANPYRKEIRLATMASHPAFPHLYSSGLLEDGLPWIAMEYVRGDTLHDYLRKGPLPLPLAARLVDELFSALRKLHESNIIHRDLKPEHLILQPLAESEYKLRILDLGHAQSTYQTDLPSRLGGGRPIGSPGYLSPELATGRPANERSDIFTAGLIIYEMLTGIPAIHIEDARADVLIAYVKSDAPLPTHPVTAIREDLPEALGPILARALDRNERKRYATVRHFREALTPVLFAMLSGKGILNGDRSMFGRFKKVFGK